MPYSISPSVFRGLDQAVKWGVGVFVLMTILYALGGSWAEQRFVERMMREGDVIIQELADYKTAHHEYPGSLDAITEQTRRRDSQIKITDWQYDRTAEGFELSRYDMPIYGSMSVFRYSSATGQWQTQ
ncbi:MAG: hypothetical protein GC162_15660 [Planctomycetes bacterium]|nr:hypothetical protein [Planctomycetota bacterium]